MSPHGRLAAAALAALIALAACERGRGPPPADFSPVGSTVGAAPSSPGSGRVSGPVLPPDPSSASSQGNPSSRPIARQDGAPLLPPSGRAARQAPPTGDGDAFTLDYVDTDIREIVRAVLGTMLRVNYIVDPALQGTATVQIGQPVPRSALVPLLAGLLAQNGAMLFEQDGVYRVTAGTAGNQTVLPVVGGDPQSSGSQVVPLRFASAQRLAPLLEPYTGQASKVQAMPGRNALIVTGNDASRANLVDLIRIFDVDYLAGQSYALFPVRMGDARAVARDMQKVFQTEASGGAVSVLPIERTNAVLVIASQPSYLDRAGKLMAQLDQAQTVAGRQLYVYFVQNGQAADLQPVLQRAFAPVASSGPGSLAPNAEPAEVTAAPPGAPPATPTPSSGFGGNAAGGISRSSSASLGSQATRAGGPGGSSAIGGVPEPSADAVETSSDRSTGAADGVRIIVDRKKNALVILATQAEYSAIEAALRRLDVLPLQVLIEATIAEVTLNDALQYGTQFFLQTHSIFAGLTQSSAAAVAGGGNIIAKAAGFSGNLAPSMPGFVAAGAIGSVQYAIQALKTVTDVNIVSSPKILILDNERARLQVGALVPVITQSATSVITTGAPVVNSVDYRETGVILGVRPRVNSGGLVTLEIEQEVSDVVATTSSTIDSPTFQQRKIQSRIVVQDGETVALAGLIQNNTTYNDSGIPLLKDIPIIGPVFGTRGRSDSRTELLLLITPRVVRDQREARALTEELRQKLAPAGRLVSSPAADPESGAPSPR